MGKLLGYGRIGTAGRSRSYVVRDDGEARHLVRSIPDLAENHGRPVARCYVQGVADAVAAVALAREEEREYSLPESEGPTATITIGMDGACRLLCEDGWREAMRRNAGGRP